MEYLHTMIRVTDLKATIAFFELMGFAETRRIDNEKGRFPLVFLAAPDDVETAKASRKPTVELTYNWDPEAYTGGRKFGHLAYAVDDIYALCAKLQKAGVTINRPPRDGHMAFIRTPDAISIELIQKGEPKAPAEPWASAANIGVWGASDDSCHRSADLIAGQHAEIFAVLRRLNHEHGEQGVARRHPERCAHHAAPEELDDAARRRRFAGIGAHRKAEAEAVTGPQQIMVLPHAGIEV